MKTDSDDNSASDPIEPGVPVEDTTSESGPTADPVSRWATEHYGFEDEAAASIPAPSSTATARATSSRRPKALLAGAVLALVLVSGAGGAAIADGDNGPGNRPNDTVQLDGSDGFRGGGDGGFDRGGDAGGRR
jgi:hypothetical protein